MSFRTRLLLLVVVTVVVSVGLVAWAVSATTRRAFEQLDAQRTAALVAQFRRQFASVGEDVVLHVEGMADAEATLRMAMDLARPNPDVSPYVNDARSLANSQRLSFVEIVADDGTIVSSAHYPARFGYKNEWVTQVAEWKAQGAFLQRVEVSDGAELALLAVRAIGVGEKRLYVIGGQRLHREFLAGLVLPAGMRALLYRNLDPKFTPQALVDASGQAAQAEKLAPLIETVLQQKRETAQTIAWDADAASAETFHAMPLTGRENNLLGVLLVGSARREIVELERFIRWTAVGVAAAGILLGVVLSLWMAARVTRPVEELAAGARRVAAGDWSARVDDRGSDEIGELARAFNRMTAQLAEQRQRLLQAERVAAWRELARRLAHELKNPLFPLQITVENLQRARDARAGQFDEVFRESTATLLAELDNLKAIVGRFSDFAKMPAPQLQAVDLNQLVRDVVKLFQAQFSAPGRPPVTSELYLAEDLRAIQADPELLRHALQNLVLNALDAMPSGGTLTLRTAPLDGGVRLTVADTGAGLSREECERLFTPYYTTKTHGTGLGLAIVQSVISDHSGKIAVDSEPGQGTTFRIELREQPLRLLTGH